MTKHECAVIMAFTGVAMLKGNDLDIFYEYVAKILCRPVYTHEMAMLSEEIKEAARDDFVQLCRNASDEDKPLTNGDKIRVMTDEELAKLIEPEMKCNECPRKNSICFSGDCIKAAVQCLKQEAKDDAGTD